MKKQLLILVMFLLPMVASAHNIEVQNADGITIYYNYTNDGTELAVTFRGENYVSFSDEYTGNVVIPEEVTYMNRTRKVTSIGEGAFGECSSLTSVTIPNSVTSIGKRAFYHCSGLTSITIGNGVKSIGGQAFFSCKGLTSITIPNSVTNIEYEAFYYCSGLTSVNISDVAAWCNIEFSYDHANPLYYAHHLYLNGEEIKDLVIPNSVTIIRGNNFSGCYGLTSVTIPNSVTFIGSSAFEECSGLTSVTIPNSVTFIGWNAFDGWDLPVVISLIENPFEIEGKNWEEHKTFSKNTFNNATLYVPAGTIDKYKATNGWKDFLFIEEGTEGGGGGGTTPEKCAKPTIGYQNGQIAFNCETENVQFSSSITDADIKDYSTATIQLGVTYNISVYATKSGYDNSETATATLCWIDKEPTTEGITDGVAQVPSKAVLIQSEGGILKVEGIDDGTQVAVYTPDGKQAGSAVCRNGAALVGTSIQFGNTAIVKIGEKSVKVIVK